MTGGLNTGGWRWIRPLGRPCWMSKSGACHHHIHCYRVPNGWGQPVLSTDRSLYKLGSTGSDAMLSLQLKCAGVCKLVRLGVFSTAWGVVCNCVELVGTACGLLTLTMTVWVSEMPAAFDFSGVLGE